MSNSTQAQLEPRPGLRERKKEQKRERLKQVAFELFSERGFDEVTVDEIADRAEVSKSTLFRYFDSKEELLLAGSRAHQDRLIEAFTARPTDEPVIVSLRAAMVDLAADFEAERSIVATRWRIMRDAPSLNARTIERQVTWEDALADAILPRLHDDDTETRETRALVLAATAMAVVRVGTRRWIATDDDSKMIDHVLDALDMLTEELETTD